MTVMGEGKNPGRVHLLELAKTVEVSKSFACEAIETTLEQKNWALSELKKHKISKNHGVLARRNL